MKSWQLALALVLITAGGLVYWKTTSTSGGSMEAESWRKTEAELRGRLAEAEKRLRELGQPLPAAGSAQTAAPAATKGGATPYSRREADLTELIRLKDEQLSRSESALAEVRSKLAEMEQRFQATQEQDKQLRESEAALRQRIDQNTEQIVELQQSSQQKDARLAQQEAALKTLRAESEQHARSLQRVRKLTEDLEDLARRRENYMTNILARYREATDSLRTLGLQLENPGEGPAATRPDISRIQSAIASADEDMRQLRSLTTRSRQVQKELLGVK